MSHIDLNPWLLAIIGLSFATLTAGQGTRRSDGDVVEPPPMPNEHKMAKPAPETGDEMAKPAPPVEAPTTPPNEVPMGEVPLEGSKDKDFCSRRSVDDAIRRCEAWLKTAAKTKNEKAMASCKPVKGSGDCKFKAVGSIAMTH